MSPERELLKQARESFSKDYPTPIYLSYFPPNPIKTVTMNWLK